MERPEREWKKCSNLWCFFLVNLVWILVFTFVSVHDARYNSFYSRKRLTWHWCTHKRKHVRFFFSLLTGAMHQIMAFWSATNKKQPYHITLRENKVKSPLFNLAQMKSKHDKEECKSTPLCCCWLSLLFAVVAFGRRTCFVMEINWIHIATAIHFAHILRCTVRRAPFYHQINSWTHGEPICVLFFSNR